MSTLREKLAAWLEEVVAAAEDGSPLQGAQVCGTAWDAVEQPKALLVGDIDAKGLAPDAGAETVLDCDAKAVVIIIVPIAAEAPQAADNALAYDTAELMGKALALAIYDGDSTLGGRVGDCLPGGLARGIDKVTETSCGCANLTLRINETGQLLEE